MAKRPKRVTELVKLPQRRRDGHKGDFGRVLVVGGSRGMVGAAALTANAALRGGAGLVTVAVPETIQLAVASLCPCATSLPLACDSNGEPAAASARQLAGAAEECDVLAVGPGMARGAGQLGLLRVALDQAKPVVLDADGLNNLAAIADWPNLRRCPLILTPHPGEFARMTGRSVGDIQANRETAVTDAVTQWAGRGDLPLVCVLKGASTVVAESGRVYVNTTGNPGMATGGSGDVLTGLVAALVGQGAEPFAAACLAVRIHGRAGDLAAEQLGEVSVTAMDIVDFLPPAVKETLN